MSGNNSMTPETHRRRRHRGGHLEEHQEGEGPWIVSYADMMTLLFCFFVIMTSFANFDPVVVAKKSGDIAEHFKKGKNEDMQSSLQGIGIQIGGHPNLKGVARAEVREGALEIVFSSSLMFKAGGVDLNPEFIKNLDVIIGLIKNRNPDYRVLVEGHTDDLPLSDEHQYRSNWELSSARSASVVDRFLYFNYKPTQLVSVGYGNSRPLAPNKDKYGQNLPENQALNRRVVIKVLKPLGSSKMKKLEIDSYFEESEIFNK